MKRTLITLYIIFISCYPIFSTEKSKCNEAYHTLMHFYNNKGPQDSISIYAKLASVLAEIEEHWEVYFEAKKHYTNIQLQHKEFEYAIEESLRVYEKAKNINHIDGQIIANISLASAYIETDRYSEGEIALQKAYNKIKYTNNQQHIIDVFKVLIPIAKHNKQYDNLHTYLTELECVPENDSSSDLYNQTRLFCDIYYAYYYTVTKQLDLAATHLKNAEKYKNAIIFEALREQYYDVCADYHCARQQYGKAIAAIDASMLNLKDDNPKEYYKQLTKKANILNESGRNTQALALYQESIRGKDSIDRVLLDKQMGQIQDMRHINKLLLETERIKNSQYIVFLAIIFVLIALLTIFTLRSLSVRKSLKESKDEVRKAKKIAEEANDLKCQFLRNMSYNIRVPLNSVVGFSELIALEPDIEETERKEYASIIKENSEKLLNLVNDVLDQSRLEAGMMKFSIQHYDAVTLCHESIYAAKSKGQPIEIFFHPEIQEQYIDVDTHRFSLLLVSLLTYPYKVIKELTISFTISLDEKKENICIKTVGSPIATPEFLSQEVGIRNEVNRLFIKRFGGTYHIIPETPEGPTIVFTYPLSISK